MTTKTEDFDAICNISKYYLGIFESGKKKSDGTLARKHLMRLKRSCDEMRKMILEQQRAGSNKLPDNIPELVREPAQHPVAVEQVEEPEPEEAAPKPIVVKKRAPRRKKKV
jgi:hypothetical protein